MCSSDLVETGQELTVSRGVDNELAVTIPAGWSGTFTVRFEGLWFWHVADAVSGAGIALTILAMVRARRREKGASTGVGTRHKLLNTVSVPRVHAVP